MMTCIMQETPSIEQLQQTIQLLEKELQLKDKDLEVYRRELVRANAQLEKLSLHIHGQLKSALRIQRQIVPTEFPHIPGFDFSSKFKGSSLSGGDYFDIFELSDPMRFGLLLSSATGYGLSALFLSLFMKFTFEGRSEEQDQDPLKLLELLKQELQHQLKGTDEFHFFYGTVDRRTLEIKGLNIGEVQAMHWDQKEKKVRSLGGQQEALSESNDLFELTLDAKSLEAQDKVVLCSPGLLQMKSPGGELFGQERFYSLLKKTASSDVHALRNEIFFQAEQWVGGEELPRDLTVVVLEVKERILRLA